MANRRYLSFNLHKSATSAGKKKVLSKIDKVYPVRRPCQSSIKPSEVIDSDFVPVEHTLIDKDPLPLSALSFMTGNCIGKLYLKSIEIGIVSHSLKLFSSGFDIQIIGQNVLIKLLIFI